MTKTFADELLAGSEDESLSRAELQQLLRRAALTLQEADPSAGVLDRLAMINEARARRGEKLLGIDAILDDWSIAQGEMPVTDLDEDTETQGNA